MDVSSSESLSESMIEGVDVGQIDLRCWRAEEGRSRPDQGQQRREEKRRQ